MNKEKSPFNFNTKYKKTAMLSTEGRKMYTESNWNDQATKDGMLRITIGDSRVTVRVLDLLSNMMVHAGEEQARYASDGLMATTKEKKIISYPFRTRLQRTHLPGSILKCEIQIEVPVELMDLKGVTQKNIIHEGDIQGTPIISAPKGAGKL